MGRPVISGNTALVDYGIQTEDTDYRAHVGFFVGAVYIFETAKGVLAIDPLRHRKWQAKQRGVEFVTGEGYAVPWREIPDIVEVLIPKELLSAHWCERYENTSSKGKKAVAIVRTMVKRGLVPLRLVAQDIKDQDLQIKGRDLLVIAEQSIQVKCDWTAGAAERGGTGCLALQTRECNPLRLH